MHRHGYQGRKLQRAAGPRKALIRGQVTSLVLHEQITTTEAKAKEIAPYFERLVTKAKKGDLHNRRQIRSFLLTQKATDKLIIELAPAFAQRSGGYTRVVKLGNRLGDNARMAAVQLTEKSLPQEAKPTAASTKTAAKPTPKPKTTDKPKKAAKPKKTEVKS